MAFKLNYLWLTIVQVAIQCKKVTERSAKKTTTYRIKFEYQREQIKEPKHNRPISSTRLYCNEQNESKLLGAAHHTTAREYAKRMQKRKWGKKYHTDQKLKCVKICCLSVANCQQATTWTTKQIYQTEPKRTNDCSLFVEDPRQSHYTSTEISIVIIFVAIFFRLLCICSGRFAFFLLAFCAHEILRRCGQLHNLTPCYNKCMLLNVPSAFFLLQGRCIEPPKVKNILFGITLALDSNSFPRHRLQFECCISLHTLFRRTFF